MDAKLSVYVLEVKSNAVLGHVQLSGNALIGVAACQKFEDLSFTPRQGVLRSVRLGRR